VTQRMRMKSILVSCGISVSGKIFMSRFSRQMASDLSLRRRA
jgi:hypothetical protein